MTTARVSTVFYELSHDNGIPSFTAPRHREPRELRSCEQMIANSLTVQSPFHLPPTRISVAVALSFPLYCVTPSSRATPIRALARAYLISVHTKALGQIV